MGPPNQPLPTQHLNDEAGPSTQAIGPELANTQESKKRKPNANGPRQSAPCWEFFIRLPDNEVEIPTAVYLNFMEEAELSEDVVTEFQRLSVGGSGSAAAVNLSQLERNGDQCKERHEEEVEKLENTSPVMYIGWILHGFNEKMEEFKLERICSACDRMMLMLLHNANVIA
ncbi:hypothetical protein P8452_51366 [Trifolium repens]|nr:hypothetical protein P8452_51366 [Trifolium repens]